MSGGADSLRVGPYVRRCHWVFARSSATIVAALVVLTKYLIARAADVRGCLKHEQKAAIGRSSIGATIGLIGLVTSETSISVILLVGDPIRAEILRASHP